MSKWTISTVLLTTIVVVFLCTQKQVHAAAGPQQVQQTSANGAGAAQTSPLIESGGTLFASNCAFCHGRDAGGGETGPDLTRSKLVTDDVAGSNIFPVVRSGRPDKGMPAFNFSDGELNSLQAFLHNRVLVASTQKGGRRGVDVSNLQTGNKDAGLRYFQGAGGCTACHSASGDLAGVATRYQGLKLEQRMLYPGGAKVKVTVTTASGETISGTLAYRDEFTIGLRDPNGTYRSWPTGKVKISIADPLQGHVDLFPKYTDDDIHNLMAYLQTLR